MSTFMCSDAHISALVTGAEHYGIDFPRGYDPGAWFAVLVAENKASVTARYGKRGAAEMTGRTHFLRRAPLRAAPLPALHVLKLAQSYSYQSCEHDGWETSDAKKWIDGLIYGLAFKIPGYDAAPWSI